MKIDAPHNNLAESGGVFPEDQARAHVYALLGRFFYEPPSGEFLQAVATSQALCQDGADSEFCHAWLALRQAAAGIEAAAVEAEFDAAFIGTGRQPVMLYGSFYLTGFLNERPLAILRDELTQMGIARRGDRHESEDHISALCDVMRFLIVGDQETTPAALGVQRDFFARHIRTWDTKLWDAVESAAVADFYRHVARFARAFFDLENESFTIA